MLRIRFLFIGEGPSDAALVSVLQELCLLCGADEVSGNAPDFSRYPAPIGHRVIDKCRAALRYHTTSNLLFIHRDADDSDPSHRYDEIRNAIDELELDVRHVAVVPVQELESWLLLDEAAIRQVAENPRGRLPLELPRPSQVEAVSHPKERLQKILIEASEISGRKRRQRFKQRFPQQRRLLVERLDLHGPLERVPAWKRLRADLEVAIQHLAT